MNTLLESAWRGACAASVLAVAAASAQAAAVYSEHWDGPASARGWVHYGDPNVQVVGHASSGLPPGSLASVYVPDGTDDTPQLRAHSGAIAALEGDFRGHAWTISFDARLLAGDAERFLLRYHTYDFPHTWQMLLDVPALGEWAHYEVFFDADWTDEQAIAAGWFTDSVPGSSFSGSMGWVTGTELTMDLADGTTTALMNIDNFVQTRDGGNVPEPASLALAALGLAGMGLARSRRRPRSSTVA